MRQALRLIAYAGAGTVVLLGAPMFLMSPVEAAEAPVAETTRWLSLGPASISILALGAICIVCFAIALRSARREDAWPHWRSLILGCGEAAFLVGIIGTFSSMLAAFHAIAAMGAAVTPADLAGGYALAIERLLLGSWVALIALVAAGILGLTASVVGRLPAEERSGG